MATSVAQMSHTPAELSIKNALVSRNSLQPGHVTVDVFVFVPATWHSCVHEYAAASIAPKGQEFFIRRFVAETRSTL
jgi:hypothetical protein